MARLLLESDYAGDAARAMAAAVLLADRDEILLCGRRIGTHVSGRVATRPGSPPLLRYRTGTGITGRAELVSWRPGGPPLPVAWWRFARDLAEDGADEDGPLQLVAARGSERWAAVTLPASPWAGPRRAAPPSTAPTLPRPPLGVVIPIFGDPDSLAACLEALDLQAVPDLRVVVVDDAAPDPAVSHLGRDFCRTPGRTYRRHAVNAGFAAAVNLGLSLCPPGDVLLLNSDVVLPPGAIGRLRAAAGARDVGILAPLSNDAGNTTFPDALFPAAPLPQDAAAAVDEAARRVNAGRIVDMPSVLGSCLYVTQACREAVGPLSHAYGRGYYEDVDLCLRARQRGFRVVALCDTYVSHFSGRSFGADRARLVTHNMAVLDGRFPDHAGVDAASDVADPLRPARAAVEREVAPAVGPWTLQVGRDATAGHAMAARRRAAGPDAPTLRLAWRRRGAALAVDVVGAGRGGPKSLGFALDPEGAGALRAYLARLSIRRVELFEPEALPPDLSGWLLGSGLPLAVVADGRAAAEAATTLAAAGRRAGVDVALLAMDRMTAAWLGDAGPAGPALPAAPGRVAGPLRRLGIPMPGFCAAAERLSRALVERLAAVPGLDVVVLGRCFDEAAMLGAGRAVVTGAMPVDEMGEAVLHYGIDALVLPYRDAFHWVLEAAGSGLPCGYVDGSPAGLPVAPGDLALRRAAPDEEVCDGVAAWCAGPDPRTAA